MQQNPYAYMNRSDYLLCTSYAEGFGNVVVEAIICGLPVLTTDCGGPRDIFGAEQCGIIGDNSEEGIYAMMKQVLLHREEREQFLEACGRRKRFFHTKTRVNAICELLEGFNK
jgi:glycosyltransferase involved in cell wall biosynthesis